MKEDIEILEAFRNYNKFYKEETNELFIAIDLNAKTELNKAIENLLTRYKQLEERNKELCKLLYLCTPEAPQHSHNEYISYTDLVVKLSKSIPKSKVIELMEELDKREKEELKGMKGQDRYFVKQMYNYMRKPLEELLREE